MNATRAILWLYFNRVSLIALLLIGLLGPLAIGTPLLGNIINMSGSPPYGPRDFFLLAFLVVMACGAAITSINLVNYHGGDRFGIAPFSTSKRMRLAVFVTGFAPGIVLLRYVDIATPGNQFWLFTAGFSAALVLILLVKLAHTEFADPALTPDPEHYVIPIDIVPGIGAWLDQRWRNGPLLNGVVNDQIAFIERPLALLLSRSPDGYFIAPLRTFHPGMLFALLFFLVSLAFYLTAGGTSEEVENPWPPLNYILMFLAVAIWGLHSLTFFFDRFRIPLLLPLAFFGSLAGFSTATDHAYRTIAVQQPLPAFPKPAEILKQRTAKKQSPIVIATAGGGIQAAAWTSYVLDQLHAVPEFHASIGAIAGASGGSVGAMFYLSNPGKSTAAAQESSLEYVSWGLLKPDVLRTIFPPAVKPTLDRGFALEQSWQKRGIDDQTMWQWAEDARQNRKPAFLINSTAIETGGPFLFATSSSGAAFCRDSGPLHRFHDVYRSDLRVVTAVRMGATFPYVSPTARADGQPTPQLHLVDGGYYDNYAVSTALDWLQDGLSELTPDDSPSRVLLLRVRSFPDKEDRFPADKARGWFFQSFAPLVGLYNMREAAQSRSTSQMLLATQRAWMLENPQAVPGQCAVRKKVQISVIDIVWPFFKDANDKECNDTPLSWRLNPTQQGCMEKAWKVVNKQGASCANSIQAWISNGTSLPADCAIERE